MKLLNGEKDSKKCKSLDIKNYLISKGGKKKIDKLPEFVGLMIENMQKLYNVFSHESLGSWMPEYGVKASPTDCETHKVVLTDYH
jgi:hypothetical protein